MLKRWGDNSMLASGLVGSRYDARTTANGKRNTSFSVAAGRENNETVWVNCKAWGNLSLIADRLQKGDYVLVTGRYEEYNADNGKTYKTLVADCIVGGASTASDAAEPETPGGQPEDGDGQASEDELPF